MIPGDPKRSQPEIHGDVERCPDKSPEIPTDADFPEVPKSSQTSPTSPETEIPEDP